MQEMRGKVMKSTGSRYLVKLHTGEKVDAVIKGKFRLEKNRSTNPVAVGDEVELIQELESFIISKILPRRNHIKRRSINLSKESHILAANIDLLVLVVTLSKPFTPVEFIDRVLLNAEIFGVKPMIVFNKSDLFTEKDRQKFQLWKAIYSDLDYPVIEMNALVDTMDNLLEIIAGKTSFFIGQSGVGKSTIINRLLPDLQLKTSEVSESYKTGKHTTTFAEMYELHPDGYIIDSPGVKAFGIIDVEKEEVGLYFPEMKEMLDQCKFYNCRHLTEPQCAVKSAVEQGHIAASRYKSYVSIYQDCEEQNQFRKPDHLK